MRKLQRVLHDGYSFFVRPKVLSSKDGLDVEIYERAHKATVPNIAEHQLNPNISSQVEVSYPDILKYELQHAYLTGTEGHVFVSSREVIGDESEFKHTSIKKIRSPIPKMAKVLKGSYFHLMGKNNENHGHFVTQFLPRLLLVKDFLVDQPHIKIILSPGRKKWQAKYLNLLGISEDRLVEGHVGTLQCEHLIYIPFFHGSDSLVPAKYYQQLATNFQSHIQSRPKQDNIIFLSRSSAPNRRLHNENEVINSIQKFMQKEVKVIHLEKMSLLEQIECVMSAKYIFGAQGQAHIVSLFCSGAFIVIFDLVPPKWMKRDWAESFRNMGNHIGNHVIRLYSNETPDQNRDWTHDLEQIEDLLKQIPQLNLPPNQH